MAQQMFDLQEVGQYGEPGISILLAANQVQQGLDWIAERFRSNALRVHVWRRGGKRVATLTAPVGLVSSFDDLLIFDHVREPKSAPPVRVMPVAEPSITALPPADSRSFRFKRNQAAPDVADMITEAVRELGKA